MVWRRKNFLINKDFQFRYMGRIILGIMMMALIGSFTVYYTTWAKIMDEFYNVPVIAAKFAPLFQSVNQKLALLLLLFMVVSAVVALFASHAIAGPMYRFEKSLQAIAHGDLSLRVGLRKGDEFRYLADTLNDMIAELRNQLSSDRALIEEMAEISQRIQAGTLAKTGSSTSKLTEDMQKLIQTINRLQENVGRFKLNK